MDARKIGLNLEIASGHFHHILHTIFGHRLYMTKSQQHLYLLQILQRSKIRFSSIEAAVRRLAATKLLATQKRCRCEMATVLSRLCSYSAGALDANGFSTRQQLCGWNVPWSALAVTLLAVRGSYRVWFTGCGSGIAIWTRRVLYNSRTHQRWLPTLIIDVNDAGEPLLHWSRRVIA